MDLMGTASFLTPAQPPSTDEPLLQRRPHLYLSFTLVQYSSMCWPMEECTRASRRYSASCCPLASATFAHGKGREVQGWGDQRKKGTCMGLGSGAL